MNYRTYYKSYIFSYISLLRISTCKARIQLRITIWIYATCYVNNYESRYTADYKGQPYFPLHSRGPRIKVILLPWISWNLWTCLCHVIATHLSSYEIVKFTRGHFSTGTVLAKVGVVIDGISSVIYHFINRTFMKHKAHNKLTFCWLYVYL